MSTAGPLEMSGGLDPVGLDHARITSVLVRHGRVVVRPSPGKDLLLQCPDGLCPPGLH